ncbi:MAG: protein-glutamate O-methyltransferase CheR [Filomicrobium sp.]
MTSAFKEFCSFVHTKSGLVIDEEKKYLVESKMRPILSEYGLADLNALVLELRRGTNTKLVDAVIQTMTINETFFFRDRQPFDKFKDIIVPELIKKRRPGQPLRIWSAACSTGQEPYSLLILLEQLRPLIGNRKCEIVATDLSDSVLEKAKEGKYSQFEVQRGLSTPLLLKYFKQIGDRWQVKPEYRSQINFRQFNLLNPMTGLGRFDVVFCRNVLIYFDAKTKGEILKKIRGVMNDDGVLLLGASETVVGISTEFAPDPQHKLLLRCGAKGQAKTLGARKQDAAPPLRSDVADTMVKQLHKPRPTMPSTPRPAAAAASAVRPKTTTLPSRGLASIRAKAVT